MTQEEFIDKLEAQIVEGGQILEQFDNLTPLPKMNIPNVTILHPYKNYDKAVVSKLQSELFQWEKAANIILSAYWGHTHPQRVAMFKISEPRFWHDFKECGERLIIKNLDVLRSFVKGYSLVDNYDDAPDIGDETDVLQVNQQHNGDVGHTYNINAVNANVGAGTISTGDISGNELTQHVNSETKEELRHIIDEIAKEANDLNNQDILEYAQMAQQELEKPQGEKKTIQAWLYAINGVAAIISNAAIQELVSQGIGLLF